MTTLEQGLLVMPKEYAWPLLGAFSLTIHLLFTTMSIMGYRKKMFSPEFMEKNFGDEHKKAFQGSINLPKNGYPDMGEGWYSQKLSYEDWFVFNNVIRSAKNCQEFIYFHMLTVIIAGLFYPMQAFYASMVMLIVYLLFI